MSITPLILVSEETDMRWDKLDADKLGTVGKASFCTVLSCLRRLTMEEQLDFFKKITKIKECE
jgi:hypothetical protein